MRSIYLVMLCIQLTFLPVAAESASLRMLTEEYAPISFMLNGKPDGYAVELTREIARRLDLAPEIELMPWARAYNTCLITPNSVLFSTSRTNIRESLFRWIGPIVRLQTSFYARRGANISISTLDDARNVEAIGTFTNAYSEQWLIENDFVNLESTPHYINVIKKLYHGRLDLLAGDNVTLPSMARSAGYDPKSFVAVFPFLEVSNYYAFNKDSDPALIARWRQALLDMQEDGTLQAIYGRWFPGQLAPAVE